VAEGDDVLGEHESVDESTPVDDVEPEPDGLDSSENEEPVERSTEL